jgi:hypothetical protein
MYPQKLSCRRIPRQSVADQEILHRIHTKRHRNNDESQTDLTSEIINNNDVVMDSPESQERESRAIKPTPETSEI